MCIDDCPLNARKLVKFIEIPLCLFQEYGMQIYFRQEWIDQRLKFEDKGMYCQIIHI